MLNRKVYNCISSFLILAAIVVVSGFRQVFVSREMTGPDPGQLRVTETFHFTLIICMTP